MRRGLWRARGARALGGAGLVVMVVAAAGLMGSGCQPPQASVEPLEPREERGAAAAVGSVDEDETAPAPALAPAVSEAPAAPRWARTTLHEGAVRRSSLRARAFGERVAYGFDGVDGGVLFGVVESGRPEAAAAPRALSARGQLGCLTVVEGDGGAPRLLVAVFERDAERPTTQLVIHTLDATGAALAAPRRPEGPALWPESGGRCAWLPTTRAHGEHALLLRAREARAAAPLDLWWVPLEGQAVALGRGPGVPAIGDHVVARGEGLVALSVVERQDNTRVHGWQLLRFDVAGNAFDVPHDLLEQEGRMVLATERRTLASALLHDTPDGPVLSTQIVPAVQPERASRAAPRRVGLREVTAVLDPPPRLVFVGGRWWALVHAAAAGRATRPWLVPIAEGQNTPRALPADLGEALPLSPDGQVVSLIATGAVDAAPDMARGVYFLQTEVAPDRLPTPGQLER